MALEARKWVFRCSRKRSADLWQDEEDLFYTLNDCLFAWLVTSHGCPLHPPGKLFRFSSFFGMKLVLSTISVCCLETLTIFYHFWSGFCWLGVIETKLLISLILSSTSVQSRPSRLMLSFPQSAGDNGTEPNREVTQGPGAVQFCFLLLTHSGKYTAAKSAAYPKKGVFICFNGFLRNFSETLNTKELFSSRLLRTLLRGNVLSNCRKKLKAKPVKDPNPSRFYMVLFKIKPIAAFCAVSKKAVNLVWCLLKKKCMSRWD